MATEKRANGGTETGKQFPALKLVGSDQSTGGSHVTLTGIVGLGISAKEPKG